MSNKIYTDGSCLRNPGGPSGWAFYILENGYESFASGGEKSSTNNRMELTAVIKALTACSNNKYTIFSDSKYVINCAIGTWKRKKNLDLWEQFNYISSDKILKWVWVKGHSGDEYNEICDRLAKREAKFFL